jgi:Tfp pilus assembly protein PilN
MSTTTEAVATETQLIGGGLATLPRVNLLPPEIAEHRAFRRIQFGLGGAVAAAVVVLGFLVVAASNGVSDANEELAASQAENTSLRRQTAQYANVTALYAAAAAAQTQLATAMGDEIRFSQMMNDFSLAIPSTVWVTSLNLVATPPVAPVAGAPATAAAPVAGPPVLGTLAVTGKGFNHKDVAVWLEAIAGLKAFSDPYFSSSSEGLIGKRKVVTFASTANINSAALSGRYSKPVGG